MDRAELIRRVKAARQLGGFTKPLSLAQHPLLVKNGIKESRIRELESIRGRVEMRPMELEVIARACGLPAEFFSAPFERMADRIALDERMAGLEQRMDQLVLRVPDLATLLEEAARLRAEDVGGESRPAGGDRRQSG